MRSSLCLVGLLMLASLPAMGFAQDSILSTDAADTLLNTKIHISANHTETICSGSDACRNFIVADFRYNGLKVSAEGDARKLFHAVDLPLGDYEVEIHKAASAAAPLQLFQQLDFVLHDGSRWKAHVTATSEP